MSELMERNVTGLVVQIDRLICVGFEDCAARAPEVFRLDSDGIACFTDAAGPIDRERLIDACRACPVDAITVRDESGQQIVP